MHHRISLVETLNDIGIEHVMSYGKNPLRVSEHVYTPSDFPPQHPSFLEATSDRKDWLGSRMFCYSLQMKYDKHPIFRLDTWEEISDERYAKHKESGEQAWKLFTPEIVEGSYKMMHNHVLKSYINNMLAVIQRQQQQQQ